MLFIISSANAQDVNALLEQLQSPDANVRQAAVDELAKVGAPAVPQLFKLMGGENPTAALWAKKAVRAMAHHAARPSADKERAAVSAAFVAQVKSEATMDVRSFAVEMLSFVGRDDAVPTLAALLKEKDLREMARWSLERIPGRRATEAIAKAVASADAEFKVALIKTLGARGDVAAVPTVVAALNDSSPEVVRAAVAALGNLPDARSETVLHGMKSSVPQARDALLHLAETFHAKGDHRAAERIYRQIYESATTEHEKCAGLRGLAQVGGQNAVPLLLKALQSEEITVRGVAREGLVSAPGNRVTRSLVSALKEAPTETRAWLIAILGERGDKSATSALLSAAQDQEESVRLAALRALGQWRESQAVPLFLAALRESSMELRAAGLEALTRVPGKPTTDAILAALKGANAEERAALVRTLGRRGDQSAVATIIPLVQDADEGVQSAALEALGNLRAAAAGQVVLSVLKEGKGGVRHVAAAAAVPIADAVAKAGNKDQAIELYRQAFQFSTNSNQARQIARRLQGLGVVVDLSRFVMEAGFIAHWWTLGPIPDRNALREKDPIATDAAPDLSQWKYVRLEEPTGMVDLERVVARQDNVGAYLYAEVTSDTARDVTFKIGSDDDVVVWLNGKQIHKNLTDRAWHVDEDQVPTRLEAGTNRILVKVLQGGGQWAVSLRITDRSGRPLKLEQKRP
jgi:HEAT repeat protein